MSTQLRSDFYIERIRDFDEKALRGWPHSWRFLYTPARSLFKNNGLLILGLNPGGSAHDPIPFTPDGNAYLVEHWDSQLQRKFCNFMTSIFGYEAGQIMQNSITSNLIPFRSPQFSKLDIGTRTRMLEFSLSLWKDILEHTNPKLIICIGHLVGESLRAIYGSPDKNEWVKARRQSIHIMRYPHVTIISIPHLSHWAAHCDDPRLINAIKDYTRSFLISQLPPDAPKHVRQRLLQRMLSE